jgi:hypothetical protein
VASKQPRISFPHGGTFQRADVLHLQHKYAPGLITDGQFDRLVATRSLGVVRAVEEGDRSSWEPDKLVGVLLFAKRKHHIEVLSAVVEAEYRRQRIASNLFWRLVLTSTSRSITARVPDNCDDGICFLKYLGFKAISVLPPEEEGGRDLYLFNWERKQDEQEESDPLPRIRDLGVGDRHDSDTGL